MADNGTTADVANLNINTEASNGAPTAPTASVPENKGITAGM